jgi:hypothetical protein
MRKKDELTLEHTCMQHAHPNEMVFVLLGRDVAAPAAIRAWCGERLRLGKNERSDAQIVEAQQCAITMEREGAKWKEARAPGFAEGLVRAVADGSIERLGVTLTERGALAIAVTLIGQLRARFTQCENDADEKLRSDVDEIMPTLQRMTGLSS